MRIDKSTRNMVRDTVYQGLKDGKRSSEIADELQAAYPFSDERAELIANTEIANAHSQGALMGYKAARQGGVAVRKSWVTSGNANVCIVCQDNEDAGPIDLDDEFPSGDDAPGAHPLCACVLVPVVGEEEPE
jgi:hypothetical protein